MAGTLTKVIVFSPRLFDSTGLKLQGGAYSTFAPKYVVLSFTHCEFESTLTTSIAEVQVGSGDLPR